MPTYEELVRDTVEAVLTTRGTMTLHQLEVAVKPRVTLSGQSQRGLVTLALLEVVLRASPERFVEVAPGRWARRDGGPEAGRPTRPRRPPHAGSAAAAVTPSEEPVAVEAVSTRVGPLPPAIGVDQ